MLPQPPQYNSISLTTLIDAYGIEKIKPSLHIVKSHYHLRLYNTNPANASHPAIFASKTKEVKQFFNSYNNIMKARSDYKDGLYCGNVKVDMIVDADAELAKQIMGLKNDNS